MGGCFRLYRALAACGCFAAAADAPLTTPLGRQRRPRSPPPSPPWADGDCADGDAVGTPVVPPRAEGFLPTSRLYPGVRDGGRGNPYHSSAEAEPSPPRPTSRNCAPFTEGPPLLDAASARKGRPSAAGSGIRRRMLLASPQSLAVAGTPALPQALSGLEEPARQPPRSSRADSDGNVEPSQGSPATAATAPYAHRVEIVANGADRHPPPLSEPLPPCGSTGGLEGDSAAAQARPCQPHDGPPHEIAVAVQASPVQQRAPSPAIPTVAATAPRLLSPPSPPSSQLQNRSCISRRRRLPRRSRAQSPPPFSRAEKGNAPALAGVTHVPLPTLLRLLPPQVVAQPPLTLPPRLPPATSSPPQPPPSPLLDGGVGLARRVAALLAAPSFTALCGALGAHRRAEVAALGKAVAATLAVATASLDWAARERAAAAAVTKGATATARGVKGERRSPWELSATVASYLSPGTRAVLQESLSAGAAAAAAASADAAGASETAVGVVVASAPPPPPPLLAALGAGAAAGPTTAARTAAAVWRAAVAAGGGRGWGAWGGGVVRPRGGGGRWIRLGE